GGFVLAWANGNVATRLNSPALWADMKGGFSLQSALRGEHLHFQWGQTDYIVPAAPLQQGAVVVLVAMPLPPKFAQTAMQIQESQKRYIELAGKRKLFRRTYIGF